MDFLAFLSPSAQMPAVAPEKHILTSAQNIPHLALDKRNKTI
jgi:hypothetical protein